MVSKFLVVGAPVGIFRHYSIILDNTIIMTQNSLILGIILLDYNLRVFPVDSKFVQSHQVQDLKSTRDVSDIVTK